MIAERLAADGASVAITYSKGADAASSVVKEIERGGGRAIAIQADAAEADAVRNAFELTVTTLAADFEVGPGGAPNVNRMSGATLEVVGATVTLAGRSFGTVSPGDHVELTGNAKLYVNGIER